MTRNQKIEEIIAKVIYLKNLKWELESSKSHAVKQEYDALEIEIRSDMAALGIDFNMAGANYDDIINRLRTTIG